MGLGWFQVCPEGVAKGTHPSDQVQLRPKLVNTLDAVAACKAASNNSFLELLILS